jgi:lipid-A-disaccharide synthase
VINQAEERFQAMKSACFAIAASGTVSLELAIAHIPHLIAYKVAPLTAWLARHFLKIKSVNLPNLILGETALPELLQEDCQAEKIMDTALPFIQGTNNHEKDVFLAQMRQLDGLLGVGKLKPSRRAAQLIIKEIEQKQ